MSRIAKLLIIEVVMYMESHGFSFVEAACRSVEGNNILSGHLVEVFLKVSACLLISSLRNLFISSSILFISESNLDNN